MPVPHEVESKSHTAQHVGGMCGAHWQRPGNAQHAVSRAATRATVGIGALPRGEPSLRCAILVDLSREPNRPPFPKVAVH